MANKDIKVSVIKEPSHPTDETFPRVTKALLERLQKVFPNQCPELTQTERMIFYKTGQVSVVTYLSIEHERQNNKGPDNVL